MGADKNSLVARDAGTIAQIMTLRFNPLAAKGGSGSYLHEEDGRRVLDLSASATAASLGYGHPAVIEAILDDTSYPKDGDTGWARVYHHAATALCQFAQKHDGKTQKERGRKAYSFHGDGGVAEEERRREVHQSWVNWWSENEADVKR